MPTPIINRGYLTISDVCITFEPVKGCRFEECMGEAILLSLDNKAVVTFLFNDRRYRINPDSVVDCVAITAKEA